MESCPHTTVVRTHEVGADVECADCGHPVCAIHPGEALAETHPGDPENGPSPHDVENRWVCWKCEAMEQEARLHSQCLVHHRPMHRCLPCSMA